MTYNKTECILECFYDKELQACGSCYRTLEEIAEEGKRRKANKMKITQGSHYSIEDGENSYVRFGADVWYELWSETLEPVYDCEKLEQQFQLNKDK